MKVTIKTVAEAAGVSIATVSRALRNDPAAKDDTADRVRRIARELNYFPNSLAAGLRQNKTRTIGVIFNDLNNPFYTEILGEIGEKLNEADYSLIICYSHYDAQREQRNIASLLSRRVDGIIISPIDERSHHLQVFAENGVPAVIVDSTPYSDQLSYVYTDHLIGIRLSTEHLIENGHTQIALITAPDQEVTRAQLFVRGFREALTAHGLQARDELIVHSPDNTISGGYNTFRTLLFPEGRYRKPQFTGVVTISDLLATGIYKLANECGLQIPGEMSVIGYDNIEISSALTPPLTTVHQSRKRIGRESVAILLNNIENKAQDIRRVSFNPRLVVRKSVRKLPA